MLLEYFVTNVALALIRATNGVEVRDLHTTLTGLSLAVVHKARREGRDKTIRALRESIENALGKDAVPWTYAESGEPISAPENVKELMVLGERFAEDVGRILSEASKNHENARRSLGKVVLRYTGALIQAKEIAGLAPNALTVGIETGCGVPSHDIAMLVKTACLLGIQMAR